MSNNDNIIFTDATAGGSGPGSQPAELDGAELDILQLPSGMDTYEAPILPEPEDVAHLQGAKARLMVLLEKMDSWKPGDNNLCIEVQDLDAANRDLVDQVMGEGEVSILFAGTGLLRIQESVLAGVWRIQQFDLEDKLLLDSVEVGQIPSVVGNATFVNCAEQVNENVDQLPEGVINSPPLLAEINERLENFEKTGEPHIINLTLLPQTEQDLMFLDQRLSLGRTTILSRGYGNCRITSTGTKNVWWVRYFNSQDKDILTSLEICAVPEVACAAQEDIADSTIRLREILEIYQ